MGFLDELRARNGATGLTYAGDPGMGSTSSPSDVLNSIMPAFNQIRNRNVQDFKDKAQFSSDLGLRQERMRSLFAPEPQQGGVVYQPPPSEINNNRLISPFQAAGLELDKQKLAEQKRTGSDKLALDQQKFGLEKEKSDQIYQTKQDEMTRKVDDANNKLKLAYDQLAQKGNDASATANFKQAQLDALTARHELEMAQKDKDREETVRIHDAQIKDMQDKLDAMQNTITTTEMNPDKTKKIVTTAKGDSAKNALIAVISPTGQKGTVTAEDAANLPAGWKRQ